MKKFFSLTLTLAAMLSAMAVSAQAADYSFETDGTPEYYPSYYNKFGQESRAASPAFSPSRA